MRMPVGWLVGLLIGQASAQALTGFGQMPYEPLCSEACRRSFTSFMLDCTVAHHSGGSHSHGPPTTPDCYAQDTAFLTSVAWCMSTKCGELGIPASKIERYWETKVTGSEIVAPKWTYAEALAELDPRPPTYQMNSTDMSLNVTSIVNSNTYLAQWNVLGTVRAMAVLESAYGLAIFISAVGIPILLTWLGYMPFLGSFQDKIKPYLVYPSTVSTYHVRPLPYLLGNAPTVGQGVYITIMLVLNVILSAVSYKSAQPNAWYATQWREVSAYVMYRTGAFAFMLLPLLLLFSSRNNLLLWLTNWSHSTFMLLHRWIARLFMLHVVIHSIIGLQIYAHYAQTSWWVWGAVATIATVILTLASGLHVRKSNYEFFLITHIVLAVFVLVGSWYHIIQWYASMGMYIPNTTGYEVWLYIAFCIWFFDRLVRVGRVVKAGVRRSRVTDLGAGYVRVDIPDIRWGLALGHHAYVYFPTLSQFRPWENHPFSVIPSPLLLQPRHGVVTPPSVKEDAENDGPLKIRNSTMAADCCGVGITLLIKKSKGITQYLQSHDNLLTLLDGPYPNNHPRAVLRCDRVLLIAGGIGVTGLLPWAYSHWNVKLAWSVKESAKCLVDALELGGVADKDVRVGRRFDVGELIAQEMDAGWSRVGVVVSGPGALCDDVRATVVAAAKKSKTVFELEVDAFSW